MARHRIQRLSGHSIGVSPLTEFWVAPSACTRTLAVRLPNERRGTFQSGEWDRSSVPIRALPTYIGFHQRFIDGAAWDDTVLSPRNYVSPKNAVLEIKRFECRDEDWFQQWTVYIEGLADSMRKEGWLSARQLNMPRHTNLSVCITRGGELVRERSGLHRLILAEILKLESVPVVLFSVHPEFSKAQSDIMAVMRKSGSM